MQFYYKKYKFSYLKFFVLSTCSLVNDIASETRLNLSQEIRETICFLQIYFTVFQLSSKQLKMHTDKYSWLYYIFYRMEWIKNNIIFLSYNKSKWNEPSHNGSTTMTSSFQIIYVIANPCAVYGTFFDILKWDGIWTYNERFGFVLVYIIFSFPTYPPCFGFWLYAHTGILEMVY